MVLLALGLLLTAAWLWVGWYYVAVYIGESNLFYLLPAELGQFLLGFLAPLGILWLLISQAATRRRLRRLEKTLNAWAERPEPGPGPAPAPAPSAAPGSSGSGGGARSEPSLAPSTQAEAKPTAGASSAAPAPVPTPTSAPLRDPLPDLRDPRDLPAAAAHLASEGDGEAGRRHAAPKPPGNASAPRLTEIEADDGNPPARPHHAMQADPTPADPAPADPAPSEPRPANATAQPADGADAAPAPPPPGAPRPPRPPRPPLGPRVT
jgi:hypothetical protein